MIATKSVPSRWEERISPVDYDTIFEVASVTVVSFLLMLLMSLWASN